MVGEGCKAGQCTGQHIFASPAECVLGRFNRTRRKVEFCEQRDREIGKVYVLGEEEKTPRLSCVVTFYHF